MIRMTIGIPTLNRAHLVTKAIDSALAQTVPDVEIVVADNGSTDGTSKVLARYSSPRLRVFRHEQTISAAANGNFLRAHARGVFFLGLSDDDWIEPEFAREVLALFDAHPGVRFAYTGCLQHYDGYAVPCIVGPRVEPGVDFLAAHFAGRREVCWCACVCRTADLLEIGPQPDDRIIGDMYYWTRLALAGDVGCVPSNLSNYTALRPQGDNVSRGTPSHVWGEEVRLLGTEVLHGLQSTRSTSNFDALVRDIGDYVARSTANQLVWNRLGYASRAEIAFACVRCTSLLGMRPQALTRVAAALTLPRSTLRRVLLNMASRMAASRL
jgi:glycosyltransferase involved in cell wall biosynthesis